MNLNMFPYEIHKIEEDCVILLMLIDIDDNYIPVFEQREFPKEPYFEFAGKPLCELVKKMYGFMSIQSDSGSSTCTRLDASDEEFSMYKQMFKDYPFQNAIPYEHKKSYKSHLRELRIDKLLGKDETV
jgi:hypothetical protein